MLRSKDDYIGLDRRFPLTIKTTQSSWKSLGKHRRTKVKKIGLQLLRYATPEAISVRDLNIYITIEQVRWFPRGDGTS